MGYEEVKARVSETRVIKKLRRKFRRLFLSAQVQRDTSLAFAERDAALDELEYLREKYVSLEAKTLEENLINPNEVRFNFTLSPIFLNDRKFSTFLSTPDFLLSVCSSNSL